MKDLSKLTRLEERYTAAWLGRENEDCLWWQDKWWSWNKLNELALDCERKLKKSGFEKGQRIAVLLPNCPMIFALSVAAWRLGGSIAPLNARTGVVKYEYNHPALLILFGIFYYSLCNKKHF